MDSFKTGEFIKKLRIEKELTQKELSEVLNCTDKAISRWETGKGFPDIVFLTPLAKTLGITVNELLAGERLSQEELVTKSDEVIISTMQEAENDKKKWQNIIFTVLCTFQVMTIYVMTIFNMSDEVVKFSAVLYIVSCICVGILKVKVKFAFPLIIVGAVVPLELIRNGFYAVWPMFLLLSLTLVMGLVLICGTTLIKNICISIYHKWEKEHIVIKSLTAITLVLALVLGIVGIVYYEKNTEKIEVIQHISNDEAYVDELIYNGQKYYECNGNYLSDNYEKIFANNNVFPDNFPGGMLPFELKKQIDLSICVEYLPELEKGQKYVIPKDRYFIYANDSITKPTIIYIYEDSSYCEWYVSEDFDFVMPTTDTHEVTDVVLYGDFYHDVLVRITDKDKINEIITAKNNGEDISKCVTTSEYGDWSNIYINYKDSPFSERIGVLHDDGIFTYTKSWQEFYEENPHWYFTQ